MCWEAVRAVLDHSQQRLNGLLLLLVVAEALPRETGTREFTQRWLAERSRMPKRTVERLMPKLIASGELLATGKHGRRMAYRLAYFDGTLGPDEAIHDLSTTTVKNNGTANLAVPPNRRGDYRQIRGESTANLAAVVHISSDRNPVIESGVQSPSIEKEFEALMRRDYFDGEQVRFGNWCQDTRQDLTPAAYAAYLAREKEAHG